jgi:hypothetical protein
VVELRLETITTIEDANAFLPSYIVRHNSRFAVPAADPEPAWRAWPAGLNAEGVFGFHYPRRVTRDATLSWAGADLALPRRADGRSWAGRVVTVQERLDGSLWVSHEGQAVQLDCAPANPATLRARALSDVAAGKVDLEYPAPSGAHSTAPSQPWRDPAGAGPTRPGCRRRSRTQ